ncbi:MAG: UDP-N-acetylmuramate--L-alanine ligase, partial [Deltaproteobacteria bacterium]
NIDPEHLDHYGSLERIDDAFVDFANKVPFYGLVVTCCDHPGVLRIMPRIRKRLVTYGFSPQADYRATAPVLEPGRVSFTVEVRGERRGTVVLNMNGRHNILNALACIAVADELQVPFDVCTRALEGFDGVQRRFSRVGDAAGITVIDDYGHHPAEIRATIEGARQVYDNRIVVVFQPHRYTRTRDLGEQFHSCFHQADVVVVMDIYPAGEAPIQGVSAEQIARGIKAKGHRNVHYVPDHERVIRWLEGNLESGDLVLTMGAGDVWKIGPRLLDALGRKEEEKG